MPLYLNDVNKSYVWGIWQMTESLNELLALLPDGGLMYADQLNTFKSDSRKKEWLAVRVLLYTLTGDQLTIHYHSNGKPYLPDGLHISISHTKRYVALIISRSHPVGIDIERKSDRVHRLAHKFVRDDELLPPHPLHLTYALLLIWSAKEVMFKCMNEEEVDFRKHLHVDLREMNGMPLVGTESRSPHQHTYIIYYMLHSDFVMTWTFVS